MCPNTVSYFDSTYLKKTQHITISDDGVRHQVQRLVLEAVDHCFKLVMISAQYTSFVKQIIKSKNSDVLVGKDADFTSRTSSALTVLQAVPSNSQY